MYVPRSVECSVECSVIFGKFSVPLFDGEQGKVSKKEPLVFAFF